MSMRNRLRIGAFALLCALGLCGCDDVPSQGNRTGSARLRGSVLAQDGTRKETGASIYVHFGCESLYYATSMGMSVEYPSGKKTHTKDTDYGYSYTVHSSGFCVLDVWKIEVLFDPLTDRQASESEGWRRRFSGHFSWEASI